MVFGYGTFPIVLEDSGLLEAVMLMVSVPVQHLTKWFSTSPPATGGTLPFWLLLCRPASGAHRKAGRESHKTLHKLGTNPKPKQNEGQGEGGEQTALFTRAYILYLAVSWWQAS